MGAGANFTSTRNAAGENVARPAPMERMREKKADADATQADDSAPFGLTQNVEPKPNKEAPPKP